MEKRMSLAIITTSKFHFERFIIENKLNYEDVKQVQVLSDIKNVIFDYAIEIEGSDNVTNYVINRVRTLNKLTND